MEIIENKENKLLGRKEIVAKLVNEGATPKRVEIKKALAKKLKVKEELVIVNKVSNYFGDNNVQIKAKVYDNIKSLELNARPYMIKRNHVEAPVVEEVVEEAASATEEATEEAKEEVTE